MKKLCSRFTVYCLVTSFLLTLLSGCGATTEQPDSSDILASRRDQAEAEMRRMATVLWTVEEDTAYSLRSDSTDVAVDLEEYPDQVIQLVAGRVYQGLPYTHGLGNRHSFLSYSGSQNDNDIHTITGLTSQSLNGGLQTARIGNSCSGAVQMAWGTVATSFAPSATRLMTPANGFLRVGDYESSSKSNKETIQVCESNGPQTMYAAYAQLQKADAVVQYNSYGHTMMVVDVHVEYTDSGKVDGMQSYITTLHQTAGYCKKDAREYNETLGTDVYYFWGVDEKFTFMDLYIKGFLPLTCKEFIDPSPVEAPAVTDTVTDANLDNMFTGSFRSTYMIPSVTITITDAEGNAVQQATCYASREQLLDFPLARFLSEDPQVLQGSLNTEDLPAGSYHCIYTAQIATGETFTVRDFSFSVE